MKRKAMAASIALTLCIGISVGMLAAGNETISALLNREIKITYNGQAQNFTDANGAAVYPISYNGTTYLPVRAVAGLVGLPVDWDAANNTVVLGSAEKQPVDLVSRANSGATNYNWVIREAAELAVAGKTYQSGVTWHQWNGYASMGPYRLMTFDVKGYSTLTFTIWADVDAKVSLYDQNETIITSFELKPGDVVSKTVDITGVEKLGFASDCPRMSGENTDGYVKMLDPKLS